MFPTSPPSRGLDEDTAAEIQNRARDYLARIEAEYEEKRQALGVQDELRQIDGVTTPMLVAFGENGVKNIEDLAGLDTDELAGWTEKQANETVRHKGILDGFDVSRSDAEAMIMSARVKAGWIEAPAETEASEDEAETEAHPA